MDEPDGWLVQVPDLHARRDADDAELNAYHQLATGAAGAPLTGPAALIPALPAALTMAGPGTFDDPVVDSTGPHPQVTVTH